MAAKNIKKRKNTNIKSAILRKAAVALAASFLSAVALCGWNTDFFEISDNGTLLCSVPLAHGHRIETSYIHSVEKTAVKDSYIIADGKIWTWEECVRSSNAGMPSVLPKYTRFINTVNGLVFRGGRTASEHINLRSGNETYGRNTLRAAPYKTIALYKELPNRRLTIRIVRKPFNYRQSYFLKNLLKIIQTETK